MSERKLTDREQEVLDIAKNRKESMSPEHFKSWYRGYRQVGRERQSAILTEELDKLNDGE